MTITITGAAGFIGHRLARELLHCGFNVSGVDNFDPYYSPKIKANNIADQLKNKRYNFVESDIRDRYSLDKLFARQESSIVIHLAAKVGVRHSLDHSREYMDVNAAGTRNVIEAGVAAGVRRFIVASSSSVYGRNPSLPWAESAALSPLSPYGESKACAESIAAEFCTKYHLDVCVVRPFSVYGPGIRPDLVIRKFATNIAANAEIQIYGDGSARRDYTYVTDVVSALVSLTLKQPEGFEILNIGTGANHSLLDLISLIEAVLNMKAIIKHLTTSALEPPHTLSNCARAQSVIGYKPKMPFSEGIKETVQSLPITIGTCHH